MSRCQDGAALARPPGRMFRTAGAGRRGRWETLVFQSRQLSRPAPRLLSPSRPSRCSLKVRVVVGRDLETRQILGVDCAAVGRSVAMMRAGPARV